MTELHGVLERATDRIVGGQLAARAGAIARRRRRRTRAATTFGAAVASVLVVVGLTQLGSPVPRSEAPVVVPPTATPSRAPAPAIRVTDVDPATQPVWDPFDIGGAPLRPSRLPADLDPPLDPPALTTMPGVLVAWPEKGADVRLLGTDGEWRTVAGTADAVRGTLVDQVLPAISHDATRVAMSTTDGLRVVDVTTGEDRTIAWPTPIAGPWDNAPQLQWLPEDDGVIVLHWRTPWLMRLDGSARAAPYPSSYVITAVDPGGAVYQNDYERRRLITWDGDTVLREAPFVQCERMVAEHGLLACTTGSLQSGRSGPVVIDPATGDVVAYAPIDDPSSAYSDNAFLTAKGFLDPETVLLLVGPMDFRTMKLGDAEWHLVAWRFRSGEFELLSSSDRDLRGISIAAATVD